MPPVLATNSLSVSYPPVRALDSVDFGLAPGEIHALMGENGAGKSTMIRALTGLVRADRGGIVLTRPDATELRVTHFRSPHDAERAGISAVHQEIDLIPTMSVEENLLLTRHPTRGLRGFGLIKRHAAKARARAALARLGLSLDLSRVLGEFPVGLQQLVAIARAIDIDAKALILDEPTSSLDRHEVASLFRVLRDLRSCGLAILFVTHFLDQVYDIADRITVLRNGRKIGTWPTPDLPREKLVEAMTGRAFAGLSARSHEDRAMPGGPAPDRAQSQAASDRAGAPALEFRSVSKRSSVAPATGRLRAGESLGLAGLLGSGRTELARLLFGADRPDTGEIRASGEPLRPGSVRDAIAHHLAFTPEDRKSQGLILDLTVRENVVLALQARRGSLHPIPRREQLRLADHYITSLNIKTPGPEAPVSALSGGNQQKVLLARWLAIQPKVLILDEPTRGVDIGARVEIESLIADLRARGLAIVLISSELDEIVRTCDRVMVMRDRQCAGELAGEQVSEQSILKLIAAEHAPHAEGAPA